MKNSKKIEEFKSFTVDSVTKYIYKQMKNLPEMLSSFPNQGVGFKVYQGRKKDKFYIVEKTNFQDNRHGKIYGIEYNQDERSNRIELVNNANIRGRWNYEVNNLDCKTDNGLTYNIGYTERMISNKIEMLKKRENILNKLDTKEKDSDSPKSLSKTTKKNKV